MIVRCFDVLETNALTRHHVIWLHFDFEQYFIDGLPAQVRHHRAAGAGAHARARALQEGPQRGGRVAGASSGLLANLSGIVLCCIEAKFC